ncbi:MAG TPA: hypothetical protein PLB18_21840 [Acidobacteriota bacterium]|nr:hypothetical protein [Acidobacteriota bacterium]
MRFQFGGFVGEVAVLNRNGLQVQYQCRSPAAVAGNDPVLLRDHYRLDPTGCLDLFYQFVGAFLAINDSIAGVRLQGSRVESDIRAGHPSWG